MFVRVALVCVGLVLASCAEASAKLDLSSKEKFEQSVDDMRKGLSPEENDRLSKAFASILLGDALESGGLLKLAAAGNDPFAIILKYKAQLDGKTTTEIIAFADERTKERVARQQASLDAQIAAINTELAADAKTEAEVRNTLATVAIADPRYETGNFGGIVSFTIKNNGKIPLKQIDLRGTLTSPGRTIPWVDESFSHLLTGGLEPGESRSLRLGMSSMKWSDDVFSKRADLILTLQLEDFQGADGKSARKNSLQKIESLKEKLKSLSEQRAKVQ